MSAFTLILSSLLSAVFLILVLIYVYYKYYAFKFWQKRGVFFIEASVPFGYMLPCLMMKQSLPDYYKDQYLLHKEHRVLGLYALYKAQLIICDPELIREVLVKEFASFQDRGMNLSDEVDPFFKQIVSLGGQKWKSLRTRVAPAFTISKVKMMFHVMKQSGGSLSKFLEPLAQQKATVDIADIFLRFQLDLNLSTVFGIAANHLENEHSEFRYWGEKAFQPKPLMNILISFAPRVLGFLRIPYTEKELRKFFIKIFNETMKHRRANNIVRNDFFDLLMQLMENGHTNPGDENQKIDPSSKTEKRISMMEAVAQTYLFFLAGHESASVTCTCCMYELAMNQDIQDKLRDEIRTIVKKHGDLTYNAINDMTYLHKVVCETLRKYPIAGALNRVCTKDIVLPTTNISIPAGTIVTIPILGLHWDPDYYPDPSKFDPERFGEENVASRPQLTYLPFGEGPRVCIGAKLGLAQVKLAIICVLTSCKVKLSPRTPYPMQFSKGGLLTKPEGGVYLTIESI